MCRSSEWKTSVHPVESARGRDVHLPTSRLKLRCHFLVPFCLLITFGFVAFGQTAALGQVIYKSNLERAFDRLDESFNGGDGYKNETNESPYLAWHESYLMMAYVSMYEATGDSYYLKKLADHADSVLDNRDDRRGVVDYRGVSGAAWLNTSYQKGPYCYVVHSGMITYPMVRFAEIVSADASLQNTLAFDGSSLGSKMTDYVKRAEETVLFHDWQWVNGPGFNEGHYRFPLDAPEPIEAGSHLPLNQQNAMGRTLIALSVLTGSPVYRDKAERLANFFKNRLGTVDGAYVWSHRPALSWSGYTGPGEDISHAAINIGFAVAAARATIVFTSTDMQAFTTTFANYVVRGDAQVWDRIDGTGTTGSYDDAVGRWLELDPWDRLGRIFFTAQGVYGDVFDLAIASGHQLLNIANLAVSESTVRRCGGYSAPGSGSAWAGTIGADLDGDGVDEVVGIRNADGNLYGYRYDADSGVFSSYGSYTAPGSGSQWVGIAAGDLDGDGDDELAAVRNYDATILFLDSSGPGNLHVTGGSTGWEPASNWAGIGIGRFEEGGELTVALVRNYDADIFLMEYPKTGGSGVLKARFSNFGSASDFADLAVGDFDGDGLAEIAVARNFDGRVFILEKVGGSLQIVGWTVGYEPTSNWAAAAAADVDGDGQDELFSARNYDGSVKRLWMKGSPSLSGVHLQLIGASQSWGALGRLRSLSSPRDMLIGLSNRTGDFMIYEER